jgi:hypothetical protein
MAEPKRIDRVFQIIMNRMIETGRAPHYTEIATEMGLPVEEGREALRELFSPMFPGWLYAGTDYVGSFPPFSNLPTQHAVTIDGQQKWFAQ